jgi:hypothetical protein
MNPLQRVARNPAAYRRLVLPARPIAERLESFLRFVTAGRVGVLDLTGLPCVRITTKGRKTGLARTVTVQYVPVDDGLVLVGSNWAAGITRRGRRIFKQQNGSPSAATAISSPQSRGCSPERNATERGSRSWRTGRTIRSLKIEPAAANSGCFFSHRPLMDQRVDRQLTTAAPR